MTRPHARFGEWLKCWISGLRWSMLKYHIGVKTTCIAWRVGDGTFRGKGEEKKHVDLLTLKRRLQTDKVARKRTMGLGHRRLRAMLSALHTPSIGLGWERGRSPFSVWWSPMQPKPLFVPFLLILLFVPEFTNPEYVLQSYCPGVWTPRDVPKAVKSRRMRKVVCRFGHHRIITCIFSRRMSSTVRENIVRIHDIV